MVNGLSMVTQMIMKTNVIDDKNDLRLVEFVSLLSLSLLSSPGIVIDVEVKIGDVVEAQMLFKNTLKTVPFTRDI